MKLNWTQFKTISNAKSMSIQYIETDNFYHLKSFDGVFCIDCELSKNPTDTTDLLDFENNYKANANKPLVPKDSTGLPIQRGSPFTDALGFRFRGHSFKETVSANTTKDIDYLVSAERWINGGRLIVDNIGSDDKLTFQVVDKDNIFGYGAGVVLDEFIKDFYIPSTGTLEVALAYPARIYAGLYLRLKYSSTASGGCIVKCNLYLHWKVA